MPELHSRRRCGNKTTGFPNRRLRAAQRNLVARAGRAKGKIVPYNLAEAGAAVGRNRSTILKAIRWGAISATRDKLTGGWLIEPSELHRLYPPVLPEATESLLRNQSNGSATEATGGLRELQAKLDAAEAALRFRDEAVRFRDETIGDLRKRLDVTTGQLGEALQQVRALTDQRTAPTVPRRPWWPWRRG
jgi:hypothetical protein